MSNRISIGDAAEYLGVTIQTLRRWDEDGVLSSKRINTKEHRYYDQNVLEDFLSGNFDALVKKSHRWAYNAEPTKILPRFYCQDKSIFKARLSKLELLLS